MKISPPPRARFSLYAGDLALIERGVYRPPEGDWTVTASASMDCEEVTDRACEALKVQGWSRERVRLLCDAYVDPIIEAFRRVGGTEMFAVRVGDQVMPPRIPAFQKSRLSYGAGLAVLAKLSAHHHFGRLPNVAKVDIPFGEKDDRLIWRGATTGSFHEGGARPRGSRFHLHRLIRSNSNPNIDLGYSQIVQLSESNSDVPLDELEQNLRPNIAVREQLKSKFLLSLEGNDVATGLKWMLASNSCVVMPHPTVTSWACETHLRPYVHFVPVARDLRNLRDVYEWCLANKAKCEEIAVNGREFIAPFLDVRSETELMDKVVDLYRSRVTLQ